MQIEALNGVSTAEAKAQKALLEEQLSDLEEDLADTQADHIYQVQIDGLNEQKEILQDIYDKFVDSLNKCLDAEGTIISNATANWCYNNNKTYIDGAKIYTGTITADAIAAKAIKSNKIDVDTLDAISANLGTIKAGIIQSNGYKKDTKGMRISLNDGTLDSKNFSIDAEGNVSVSGTIYATSGTLSNLLVVGNKGIACEYEMGAGSGSTKQTVRISEGKISFSNIYTSQDGSSRTDTGTYIYQATSGIAFESESGEAYFKVSSMSSSALSHNNDSYVMINKQGLITANGSYLNSRDRFCS